MSSSDNARGAAVLLDQLEKSFDDRSVLRGLDLEIPPGEFVTVVGKSGSGKSTLLRILAELDTPSSGTARVIGASGGDERARVRVVFQEPRLLPWKSVLDNVCLGMPRRGRDTTRAREVLAAVGLGDRLNDYPTVLSGGQRQRVALARALVHEPSVLLLDEPFGALDALTRIEAQRLVEGLWKKHGFTAILVTHDVGEAVLLGDRVLLLEEGRIARHFHVDVPRSRRRDHPEVARLTAAVLDAIFGVAGDPSHDVDDAPLSASGVRGSARSLSVGAP